jgi:hypothetical protein
VEPASRDGTSFFNEAMPGNDFRGLFPGARRGFWFVVMPIGASCPKMGLGLFCYFLFFGKTGFPAFPVSPGNRALVWAVL